MFLPSPALAGEALLDVSDPEQRRYFASFLRQLLRFRYLGLDDRDRLEEVVEEEEVVVVEEEEEIREIFLAGCCAFATCVSMIQIAWVKCHPNSAQPLTPKP
jgi:hypothetical protein